MTVVMMAVIVSFSCQLDTNLESPGKREPSYWSMAMLWGIF